VLGRQLVPNASAAGMEHDPHPITLVEAHLHGREREMRLRESTQNLNLHDRMFQATFELATVGIVHTTVSGKLFRMNPRATELLGYTAEDFRSMRFIDITHPDHVAENLGYFQRLLAGEIDRYTLNKRYYRKDGSEFWANISVALKRDFDGEPAYLIGVIEDISAAKRMEETLRSTRDALRVEVDQQTKKLREQNQTLRAQIKRGFEAA